jgi:hypothetical protein
MIPVLEKWPGVRRAGRQSRVRRLVEMYGRNLRSHIAPEIGHRQRQDANGRSHDGVRPAISMVGVGRFELPASSSRRQHDVSLCTCVLNFGEDKRYAVIPLCPPESAPIVTHLVAQWLLAARLRIACLPGRGPRSEPT